MKLRVLFVAALGPMPNSQNGGQRAVATTLYHSALAEVVDLMAYSTTMSSIPPPPVFIRIWQSALRLARFPPRLFANDVVLVFTAGGAGLIEKGLMCLLARLAGRGVMLRISDGGLPRQCERFVLLRLWVRLLLRYSHVICSQGPFWTQYFQRFPEAANKVAEIPNAIRIPPDPIRRRVPARFRIAFVGWMQREKGIFEALNVLEQVLEHYPQTMLTLAGGGRDHEEFKTEVRNRGLEQAVEILGWIPENRVQSLLNESDVFLLPTHFEGMPNAMLEAMAVGLPVVATPVGSIPDIVEDGQTGFLTPVGDVRAMTKAVRFVFSNPDHSRQIGMAGRDAVAERYDIERVWRLYAKSLIEAAERARQDPPSIRSIEPDETPYRT